MARARNIKPAFFDNDELAEIDPIGRLLFIGLWTIADYKGDIVWREKRIKAQLLPYDNCNIKKLAINLDKSGFIRFYSDSENIYLNIVNFSKHQNPHKNERAKGSNIPCFSESMRQVIDLNTLTINHDLSGLKPEDSTCNRADSLNLIPDSLILNPLASEQDKPNRFNEFWDLYDKKRDRPKCENKFAKLKEDEIKLVFEKLPLYIQSTPDKTYRKDPIRWLNGKCWNDEIQISANQSLHNLSSQNYASGDL